MLDPIPGSTPKPLLWYTKWTSECNGCFVASPTRSHGCIVLHECISSSTSDFCRLVASWVGLGFNIAKLPSSCRSSVRKLHPQAAVVCEGSKFVQYQWSKWSAFLPEAPRNYDFHRHTHKMDFEGNGWFLVLTDDIIWTCFITMWSLVIAGLLNWFVRFPGLSWYRGLL